MTGRRDDVRAGHQAASVDMRTAKPTTVKMGGQGRSNRSMGWFAADSTAVLAVILLAFATIRVTGSIRAKDGSDPSTLGSTRSRA
jgi:hypothetical protein